MDATLTAEDRLQLVGRVAAVRWRREPQRVLSHSNDAWLVDDPARGPAVLRICHLGDRGRLITEAKVGRALPAAVGYPQVLGFGWTRDEGDLTWSLTRRLPGRSVAEAWPELTPAQRERACRQVAERLDALHRWRPSAAVADRLLARSPDPPGSAAQVADRIVGATLNPLPLPRVRSLAEQLDQPLARTALAWLEAHAALAPPLDRPDLPVTHQDLHLHNVWWDGERVSGLLDFEWVRRAPAWTDLGRVTDEADADVAGGDRGHAQLRETILRRCPQVQVPALPDRLRFWRIAYAVRELWLWPALAPGGTPPPGHPIAVLTDLLG